MKDYLNVYLLGSANFDDKYVVAYSMAHAEELFREEFSEQPTRIATIDTHVVVEIKELP